MDPGILWGIISRIVAVVGIPASFVGGWFTNKYFAKAVLETLKLEIDEIKPLLQKENPKMINKIDSSFEKISTSLDYIATGIIKIGGSTPTSFNPLGPGMTSSIITEQRFLSDGTEDYLKNK